MLGSPQCPRVPPGVWSGGSEGYVVMMRERLQDTASGPHLAALAPHAPVPAARSRVPSSGPASAAGEALASAAAAAGPALAGTTCPAPAAAAAGTDGCAGGRGGCSGAAAAGRGLNPSQAQEPEPACAPGGDSAPAEEPALAPAASPALERAVERVATAAERRPRARGAQAPARRGGRRA